MVLVNGADGIGTGWASKIPNYNPREIVENLLRMLDGQEPKEMVPWFKNFRGTISKLGYQKYVCNGELARLGPDRVEITELPVGTWTTAYKEEIEKMMTGQEIQDFEDYSTDDRVGIVVKMDKEKLRKAKEENGLHAFFKLQTTMSTSSMVLFDHMGCIRTYEAVEDILVEFFGLRLDFYGKRKAYMENMLAAEICKLSNQARFVSEMCEGELKFEQQEKQAIIEELVRRKYDSHPLKEWDESQGVNEWSASKMSGGPDFGYLMSMPMWNLTKGKIEELGNEREKIQQELTDLMATSKEELWRHDLQEFLVKLDEVEEDERRDYNDGCGRREGSLKVPKVLVSSKNQLEISEETKMLMKERDIAFARKKRTKCTRDIQYWKRLRNRVAGIVRKANKASMHDLMEESVRSGAEAKLVIADSLPSKNAVRVEPKVGILAPKPHSHCNQFEHGRIQLEIMSVLFRLEKI